MMHVETPTAFDVPPELRGLQGVTPSLADLVASSQSELGLWPAVLIGGGIGAATIAEWLADDDWSVGVYNLRMKEMNDTIAAWDQLGWRKDARGISCWAKYPARRKAWKTFWSQFSAHYGAHGQISRFSFVSDAEEKPARILMKKLNDWGKWFDRTCGLDVSAQTAGDAFEPAPPTPKGPLAAWGPIMMWGAIGLGALVVLNVVQGVRGLKS